MMISAVVLVAIWALLLALPAECLQLTPQAEAITAVVANEERCFSVISKAAQDRMMFAFQVRQGSNDFTIRIDGPDGNTIYVSENGHHDHEDSFYFVGKLPGEHTICVDNRGFGKTEKVIRFTTALQSAKSRRRVVNPLLHSMAKAEAKLIALNEDQTYLRAREVDHRTTLESNNTRLAVRWVIEVAVLLALSVGQVLQLRRQFQKRAQRAA